jgi:hypothetical protein
MSIAYPRAREQPFRADEYVRPNHTSLIELCSSP